MFQQNIRLRQKCHTMVCVTRLISWWYRGVTYLSDLTGGSCLPLSVHHFRRLLQVCESIYGPLSRFVLHKPCLLISIASLIQHGYLWSSVSYEQFVHFLLCHFFHCSFLPSVRLILPLFLVFFIPYVKTSSCYVLVHDWQGISYSTLHLLWSSILSLGCTIILWHFWGRRKFCRNM